MVRINKLKKHFRSALALKLILTFFFMALSQNGFAIDYGKLQKKLETALKKAKKNQDLDLEDVLNQLNCEEVSQVNTLLTEARPQITQLESVTPGKTIEFLEETLIPKVKKLALLDTTHQTCLKPSSIINSPRNFWNTIDEKFDPEFQESQGIDFSKRQKFNAHQSGEPLSWYAITGSSSDEEGDSFEKGDSFNQMDLGKRQNLKFFKGR